MAIYARTTKKNLDCKNAQQLVEKVIDTGKKTSCYELHIKYLRIYHIDLQKLINVHTRVTRCIDYNAIIFHYVKV